MLYVITLAFLLIKNKINTDNKIKNNNSECKSWGTRRTREGCRAGDEEEEGELQGCGTRDGLRHAQSWSQSDGDTRTF